MLHSALLTVNLLCLSPVCVLLCPKHVSDISAHKTSTKIAAAWAAGVPCPIVYTLCGNQEKLRVTRQFWSCLTRDLKLLPSPASTAVFDEQRGQEILQWRQSVLSQRHCGPRALAGPGGTLPARTPLTSRFFSKALQFSGNFEENPLFWANFGLRAPLGVKTLLGPPDQNPGSAPAGLVGTAFNVSCGDGPWTNVHDQCHATKRCVGMCFWLFATKAQGVHRTWYHVDPHSQFCVRFSSREKTEKSLGKEKFKKKFRPGTESFKVLQKFSGEKTLWVQPEKMSFVRIQASRES